ncbi:MerR family transcriptional regulator [Nonomuraea antri]|uniref:MerR family transcriptional regulator n=1 Tax=Nonomuraea antri TaxID=2730852 RepID=UPI001C2B8124|nr:MerR family transcriptional regulator [Nonomuraea antri]
MAELSSAAGIPVPTIKYYLREGLLPPGRPLGRNQADYGPEHVRRLKLIRALLEYGGLGVAAVRELLRHMDDPGVAQGDLLALAQLTIVRRDEARPGPHRDEAERIVAGLLERRGWGRLAGHQAVRGMVALVATLGELGRADLLGVLDDYAAAAQVAAEGEIRVLGDVDDRERAVEVVVLGTLLGDALLAAMRRVAQADVSNRVYGPPEDC